MSVCRRSAPPSPSPSPATDDPQRRSPKHAQVPIKLGHEHASGIYEAELFEQQGDYAPVALAVVTEDQVEVIS